MAVGYPKHSFFFFFFFFFFSSALFKLPQRSNMYTHRKQSGTCVYTVVHASSNFPDKSITKTRLFKYVEIFTSKNRKFLDKKSDIFFIFLLKT